MLNRLKPRRPTQATATSAFSPAPDTPNAPVALAQPPRFAVNKVAGDGTVPARAEGPPPSRVDSSVRPVEVVAQSGGSWFWRSFLLIAVLPAVLVGIYLFFWATPQFVSEARVVVRTAQDEKQSGLDDAMSFLSKIGGGVATKATISDAYIVAEYIKSRAIVLKLGGTPALEQYFAKNRIDMVSRMSSGQSIEDAWYYWRTMVSSSIDTQSGIINISARAYSADDAYQLVRRVISLSEIQLNEMSRRSRNDAIDVAVSERDKASERLRNARTALLVFRSENQSLDPVRDAGSLGEILAKLTIERIETENEISVSSASLSPDSPTRRIMATRLQAIDDQIATIQQKLTGAKAVRAISQQLSKYEELQLEVKFAERLYSLSEDAIDKAHKDADRQQLYLTEVVPPSVPEFALFPKATMMTFFTFLGGVAVWMVGLLTIAGIRDHMV